MTETSIPLSRRALALGALTVSSVRHGAGAFDGSPKPSLSVLGELPEVASHSRVAVYRLVLGPGQTWNQTYPGPVSVTVESGTMTVAEFGAKHLEGTGGYEPTGCVPTMAPPPTFTCGSGFYAAYGDFGTIANATDADLSVFILMARPIETESEGD